MLANDFGDVRKEVHKHYSASWKVWFHFLDDWLSVWFWQFFCWWNTSKAASNTSHQKRWKCQSKKLWLRFNNSNDDAPRTLLNKNISGSPWYYLQLVNGLTLERRAFNTCFLCIWIMKLPTVNLINRAFDTILILLLWDNYVKKETWDQTMCSIVAYYFNACRLSKHLGAWENRK